MFMGEKNPFAAPTWRTVVRVLEHGGDGYLHRRASGERIEVRSDDVDEARAIAAAALAAMRDSYRDDRSGIDADRR